MTTYTLAKKVILTKKKTKAQCLALLDIYVAADRITADEYDELVALVGSTYGE